MVPSTCHIFLLINWYKYSNVSVKGWIPKSFLRCEVAFALSRVHDSRRMLEIFLFFILFYFMGVQLSWMMAPMWLWEVFNKSLYYVLCMWEANHVGSKMFAALGESETNKFKMQSGKPTCNFYNRILIFGQEYAKLKKLFLIPNLRYFLPNWRTEFVKLGNRLLKRWFPSKQVKKKKLIPQK